MALAVVKLTLASWPSAFIVAEVDWKPLGGSSATLEQVIDLGSDFQVTIDIELTLTKRIPPGWIVEALGPDINEAGLTEAAFAPKTYKMQLIKGVFTAADWLKSSGDTEVDLRDNECWHGFRLLFDKSLYPPLEEWIEGAYATKAARAWKPWNYKDFYSLKEKDPVEPTEEQKKRREEVLEKVRQGLPLNATLAPR
ncbi:hypothetical protein VMCG_01384 [Cytospora schulzeri]|uniref:Uncharacterized protein n=1 Tax=Cytospora schulzeri TaxID=448051 RepID=A0A423X5U8_9PEZI|nr:hypothetical protein VMCG_01384 [Valsa malicola]